jgi:general stress protein YciG
MVKIKRSVLEEARRQLSSAGGKARNKNLSPERIKEIARRAGILSGAARRKKKELAGTFTSE